MQRNPALRRVTGLRIVGRGSCEGNYHVDNYADVEKSAGEQVQDTHAYLSLVEFVGAQVSEHQAQNECYPLVFWFRRGCGRRAAGIRGNIGGVDVVVHHHWGRHYRTDISGLASAAGADYRGRRQCLTAAGAEFRPGIRRSICRARNTPGGPCRTAGAESRGRTGDFPGNPGGVYLPGGGVAPPGSRLRRAV